MVLGHYESWFKFSLYLLPPVLGLYVKSKWTPFNLVHAEVKDIFGYIIHICTNYMVYIHGVLVILVPLHGVYIGRYIISCIIYNINLQTVHNILNLHRRKK